MAKRNNNAIEVRSPNTGTAGKVVIGVVAVGAAVGLGWAGYRWWQKRQGPPAFTCTPGQLEGKFFDRYGNEWTWWNTEGTIDHERTGEIKVMVNTPDREMVIVATFKDVDPEAFCDAVHTYLRQRGVAS